MLGVDSAHVFRSWGKKRLIAGTAAETVKTLDWQRLSAGDGTKGPRLHDYWCYLELADFDADEFNEATHGLWTRGLLIRRHITDGEFAHFTTWCPAGTSIETLVNVEGGRWSIEDSFEMAKNEFGLDHNETRSWHGWHRHVSLVMMAFTMMAAIRHQANQSIPKKTSQKPRAVDPGNPANSATTQAATHQCSLYHCMVAMATRPPSRRSRGASQTKITTVMLGAAPPRARIGRIPASPGPVALIAAPCWLAAGLLPANASPVLDR